jgi:hypothetical protein
MRHRAITFFATVLFLAAGCETPLPRRDAGNAQWVRQAFPKVLGRPLRNQAELNVYTDLLGKFPRGEVVDAMIETNFSDYNDHWSGVLADHLWVQGAGGIGSKTTASCYQQDSPPEGPATPALAECVAGANATDSCEGGGWSMAELISSSLVADDLSPILRAHLFVLVAHPVCGAATVQQMARRQDLSDTFHKVYLGRRMDCLGCHNTNRSVSGPATGWDRHFPTAGFSELALYGAHSGPADAAEVYNFFRTRDDCGSVPFLDRDNLDADEGSVFPFGMVNTCVNDGFVASGDVERDPLAREGNTGFIRAKFAGRSGTEVSVWDLEELLREGIYAGQGPVLFEGNETSSLVAERALRCGGVCDECEGNGPPALTEAQNVARTAAYNLLKTRCMTAGCHVISGQPLEIPDNVDTFDQNLVLRSGVRFPADGPRTLVVPGDADASTLYRRLEDGNMPQGESPRFTQPELLIIREWIQGREDSDDDSDFAGIPCCQEAPGVCDEAEITPQDIAPANALARLTRQNLVNSIHNEIFGKPLVITNFFPRNEAQRERLSIWAEVMGQPEWSLRRLVRAMVTSPLFNRPAPAAARLAAEDDHFEIWPLLDPWTPVDPNLAGEGEGYTGSPPQVKNSVADGVHRHNVRTLFNSLHSALGWPVPRFRPRGASLEGAMGQRLHDAKPGFPDLGFAGLIQWEDAVADCRHPEVPNDWISILVERIEGGEKRIDTLGEAVAILKDRLLGDSSIAHETDVLGGLLEMNAATDSTIDLEGTLRSVCGAMLMSPQFLLAGAPMPVGRQPVLSVPVCLPDESCTYSEICEDVVASGGLRLGGSSIRCPEPGGRRLRVRGASRGLLKALEKLCPRGLCGILPIRIPEPLPSAEAPDFSIVRSLPPLCDPRCEGPECCGRMGEAVLGFREGVLIAPAAGGIVKKALGVHLVSASGSLVELAKDDVLTAGDILKFDPGAVFKARTPMGAMRTSRRGLPAWDHNPDSTRRGTAGKPWYMLIAAAGVPDLEIPRGHPGTVSRADQRAFLARPDIRWGASGPITAPAEPVCVPTSEMSPGDEVDNDCDGLVDEESLDGKDDDGDGLIDEDLMATNCAGDFATFDGTELIHLTGDCLLSSLSLTVSCPYVKAAPFEDNGASAVFELSATSPSIATASGLSVSGMTDATCQLEAFPGSNPVVQLDCTSATASCNALFEPW